MAYRAISQGMPALSCAFLLEIHSWFRRGLWIQRAVTPPPPQPLEKIVPRIVERALDWESGGLGLILVPPVTHLAALWFRLGSS